MKIFKPSQRLIDHFVPARRRRPRPLERREALRTAAVLGVGATILAACSGEDNEGGGGGGGTGSGDCTEPDPTDGEKLVAPGEGEDVGEAIIKVRTARLSDNVGLMEISVPPKELLIPHTHEFDDQMVYVIAGELEFEFGGEGGETFVAPTGSYVIKPRYLQHGFWNPSDTEDARYIELSTRSHFEPFVIESQGASNKKEVDDVAAQYGITFNYGEIPRLLVANMLTGVKGMDEPMPGVFEPNGDFIGS